MAFIILKLTVSVVFLMTIKQNDSESTINSKEQKTIHIYPVKKKFVHFKDKNCEPGCQ